MRVYIYTLRYNPVSGGGSHRSLEIFIRALAARGHTPILTTFSSDDNSYGEKSCEMREENFKGGFITLQRHISDLMSENADADIHHLYGPTVMWAGGMYAQKGGTVPVVVSLNNYTPGMGLNRSLPASRGYVLGLLSRARNRIHILKWYLWEKLVGIRLARKIGRFYFDSPVIEKRYREFGYFARSSLVIPAPMESAPANVPPAPFQRDAKIFHAVFAGRLIRDKGPDLLVKAALRLPEDIHIHFIGIGNEGEGLKTFIRDNDLAGRVFLYGWKSMEELFGFYKNADVFVQPSRWPEPFGRTAADALGCGTPVIATENTGAAWAAGDAGMTFKKDSVEDLARCILFFFNNPNERAGFSKRALARARIFDADVVSRQFVTDLESLVKSFIVS
ncbi:MAG: glycosyltransferase family 4 protein [bacterium]|nr:glycosyltransferase family 4 protein [bacterium]